MANGHIRDAHNGSCACAPRDVQTAPHSKRIVRVAIASPVPLVDIDTADDENDNDFDVDAIVDNATKLLRERSTTASNDEIVSY